MLSPAVQRKNVLLMLCWPHRRRVLVRNLVGSLLSFATALPSPRDLKFNHHCGGSPNTVILYYYLISISLPRSSVIAYYMEIAAGQICRTFRKLSNLRPMNISKFMMPVSPVGIGNIFFLLQLTPNFRKITVP